MHDLVIKNGTLVTPGIAERVEVAIDEGKVTAIGSALTGRQEIDATNMLLFPGVIDAHTHMALPVGGTRSSDDFLSGTAAAACGGVTTIVDFTVGSRDTTITEEIEHRKDEARTAVVDYALHAEVIGWRPDKSDEFREAIGLGVKSFKFYTAYAASGRASDNGVLYQAFCALAALDATTLVHCEDEAIIESIMGQMDDRERARMTGLARSRPSVCEGSAVEQVVYLTAETGVRTHIVHVSSGLGLAAVKRAKARGVQLTAETCPQYLLLTRGVYEREDGHLFSASPALRDEVDRQELWNGLRDGALDLVATDHCPFTRAQKVWKGSFLDLPYGLPGVETLLPLLYSEGVETGRLALTDLPKLLSERPARINGIYPRKGCITVGADGDIVIFDPTKNWTIRADDLHMNTDFSPYEGRKVHGCVAATIARGKVVYNDGVFCSEAGWGQFVPST